MGARLALLVLALLAAGGWCAPAWAGQEDQGQPSVLVTRVHDTITPVVAEHLVDGVAAARSGGHEALVVELDTPGGLSTAMREIVRSFLGAEVPVVVHVALPVLARRRPVR